MKQILYILIAGLLLTTATSCEDWLDVRPKTEVKVDDNFKTAQGFKDALTGIYLLMCDESLYGRELSFGMVDVLGKQITQPFYSTNAQYYYIAQYSFEEENSKSVIDPIWKNMYHVIANVNSLITHIDQADESLFTGVEYHIVRGEAYALRAFLHFDLLRLFGHSYKAGADTKAIPYETTYDHKTTPLSTVSEAISLALADLTVAEQELAEDPVITDRGSSDYSDYLRFRFQKFNYFAVKLLQARIHLYKEDYTEAFSAASRVIQQESFTWVPSGDVTTTIPAGRNMIFWQELVFALNITNLQDIMSDWERGNYTKSTYQFATVYETAQSGYSYDYRYQYLTADAGYERYHIKLAQYPDSDYGMLLTQKLPVMRLSEAYYIAAECRLRQNDAAGAVGYLNTVRQARNLGGVEELLPNLSADQIQEEIFKEYAKEFAMEGQLFYYYKRLNSPAIRFYTGTMSGDAYVLPMPLSEREGRLNEQP